MKWVKIGRVHVNTDQVQLFHWVGGQLWLYFAGKDSPTAYEDPDRDLYLRLCRTLGVQPREGETRGEG